MTDKEMERFVHMDILKKQTLPYSFSYYAHG